MFDRARLIAAVGQDPCVVHGEVDYVNWKNLAATPLGERLPLIKRRVYRAEREYRFVATPNASHEAATYDVGIPLSCITSVAVSGETPSAHFESFKALVRDIPGCRSIRVRHSGLLQNPRWASALQTALAPRP